VRKPWIKSILLGLIWAALGLAFLGLFGYAFGLVQQLRALTFPHVTGHVTHSAVTSHDSDEDTVFGVNIRYHYEVNGQSFEGRRYRYGAGSSSDSTWAFDAVRHYPEDAEATVYYNPRNPSESLLSPGLDGSSFMMLLIMTPFCAPLAGFWIAGFGMLRAKLSDSPNGGVKFFQNKQSLRVRLTPFPAYYTLFAATGLLAFLELFPIAFFYGGFHPRIAIARAALIIAYGYGLQAFLQQCWRSHRGRSDLVIDYARQTVELPATFGRKTKLQIDLSAIDRLTLKTTPHEESEDGPGGTCRYVPTLYWQNGDSAKGKLAKFRSKSKAEQFVEWLHPQLKSHSSNE
jgi:hypothetical protein